MVEGQLPMPERRDYAILNVCPRPVRAHEHTEFCVYAFRLTNSDRQHSKRTAHSSPQKYQQCRAESCLASEIVWLRKREP